MKKLLVIALLLLILPLRVGADTVSVQLDDQGKQTFNLNLDKDYSSKWSSWFDYTYVRETQNKDKEESMTGAGPKYTFYNTGDSEASLSVGVLIHRYEGRKTVKASIRPRIQNKYGSITLYYIPNLNDGGDYLYSGEVNLTLTKGFKGWYNVSYKSVTEDNHYSYEGGIEYEFK